MKALAFSMAFLLSLSAAAAEKTFHIKMMGNAGLHLWDENFSLYIDFPYKSGFYGYQKYDEAVLDSLESDSFYLFTHGHADYFKRKHFRKTKGKLFGPKPVMKWTPKKKRFALADLNKIPDFQIELFETDHKLSFEHYSYLITWHGKRIYISGDTETPSAIMSLENFDIAFVPVWLLTNAKEENVQVNNTKKLIVYHLREGAKDNSSNPEIEISELNQLFSFNY